MRRGEKGSVDTSWPPLAKAASRRRVEGDHLLTQFTRAQLAASEMGCRCSSLAVDTPVGLLSKTLSSVPGKIEKWPGWSWLTEMVTMLHTAHMQTTAAATSRRLDRDCEHAVVVFRQAKGPKYHLERICFLSSLFYLSPPSPPPHHHYRTSSRPHHVHHMQLQ